MRLCPQCGAEFAEVRRSGPTRIYCSRRCIRLRWEKNNPEFKRDKSLRGRRYRLAKYGWTIEQLQQELVRQNYSCYGCLTRIDEETARVDHSHTSNQVRGLLCDRCNWTLGHAKENPATLRRLMAYLDRDRKQTLIYIIGALKNSRVPEIGIRLRKEGFDVMDEWFTPGPEADINWQKYEKLRGRTYKEALRGRAATNIFLFDRAYLELSDIVVMVAPAGKSAMIELGYAAASKKNTFILLDGADPEKYDIMPGFVNHIVHTEEELIEELKKLNGQS